VTHPLVVLVGPPGSGKTAVGRHVATAMQVGFRDTDHDVEATAGTSVAAVFVTHGEPEFRRLERNAVRAALATHSGVLALGGGAVTDNETREALQAQRVIFLDVAVPEAMRRVGMTKARPLLVSDNETVRQRWTALYRERRPLYEEVADALVSTDKRTVAEVAAEVIELVRQSKQAS